MRRLLIATALVLVAPLAAAQAYKWTDAGGTVHYSDAPPPQGTKFNKVTTSGTVEPLAAPPVVSSGGSPEVAPNSGPKDTSLPDTPENRAKLCSNLKSNMETLKGSAPVVMDDGGQQKVMSGDQRKQQQAAAQGQYQQYCGN